MELSKFGYKSGKVNLKDNLSNFGTNLKLLYDRKNTRFIPYLYIKYIKNGNKRKNNPKNDRGHI